MLASARVRAHFDDARVLVVAVGVQAVGVVGGRHRSVGHILRVPRVLDISGLRTHLRQLLEVIADFAVEERTGCLVRT